jgi:hypothetical protein
MYETIQIPEYFQSVIKQMVKDVTLIVVAILVISVGLCLLDFWCRWREVGRKYGVK